MPNCTPRAKLHGFTYSTDVGLGLHLTINNVRRGVAAWSSLSSWRMNVDSCTAFKNNTNLKTLFTIIKSVSRNFYVDERMVWVEISGLQLCALGSNAFKKVVASVGSWSINIIDSSSHNSEADSKVDVAFINEDESECEGDFHELYQEDKVERGAINPDIDSLMVLEFYWWIDEGIYESKMMRLEVFRIKSMWENYMFDYASSLSQGRSGGLISIWDPNVFVKIQIWCDDSYIIMQVLDLPLGWHSFTWMNKEGTHMSKLRQGLVTEHLMARSGTDLKMAKLVMSSPNHPTSDIEDAFSSNFPDYILASPDYVPASPGKTYSSSSNNSFSVVPIVSPTLSLFHNDPFMKVMHAYYAKESPIPPPTIVPPSTMPSSMFNPQEFFLPEELLSPKKQGHNQSFSFTSALPQEFEMGESSLKTSLERHEERIEEILNHLDELSLHRIST
ncbi:hypothetical protein Tco_0705907 [Tanacetum coccineum]|uniref:Uncharacterized protein n=1 Tax=Tanacetum coccineum TaxID=301880 RepID=A0ABQ4Y7G9_9ASTR